MKKKLVVLILFCIFLNTAIVPGSIELPVPVPRLPCVQSSVHDVLAFADLPGRILNSIARGNAPLCAQLKAAGQAQTGTAGYVSLQLFTIIAGKRMISIGESTGEPLAEAIRIGDPPASSVFRESCQRRSPRLFDSIMLLLLAYLIFVSRKSCLPWAAAAVRPYGISPNLPLKVGFFYLPSEREPQ